jgi:hypothetical protein
LNERGKRLTLAELPGNTVSSFIGPGISFLNSYFIFIFLFIFLLCFYSCIVVLNSQLMCCIDISFELLIIMN